MQVSVEKITPVSYRIAIEVPAERIDKRVEDKLKKISQKVQLPGFRKGKAPFKVVEKLHGEETRYEAIHELMEDTFKEALTKENLNLLGYPNWHHDHDNHPAKGEGLQFSVEFEVYPEINLPAWDQITLEKPVSSVEEEDVQQTIQNICKQYAQWKTAERPLQSGDIVKLDFKATIEGKEAHFLNLTHPWVQIGTNRLPAEIEAFLMTCEVGVPASKEFTFPEDHENLFVAGKTLEISLQVHEIKSPVIPELREDLIRSLGIQDPDFFTAFSAKIKQILEQSLAERLREKTKKIVLDALSEQVEILLPPQFLSEEKQELENNFIDKLKSVFAEMPSSEKEAVLEKKRPFFEKEAEKRVKRHFLLKKVIQEEKIMLDPEKLFELITKTAENYEHPKQVFKDIIQSRDLMQHFSIYVLEEQAIEKMLSFAKVVEKYYPFKEVVA